MEVVISLDVHDERVRAPFRENRKFVGVPGPVPDGIGERRGDEGLGRPAADDEDLAERLELGVGQTPGPEIEELASQEVGRRLEGVVGHEVEEESSAGMKLLREADEESVLEPPVLGILVVGWIQVEDGRAVALRAGRAELESVPVVGVVDVESEPFPETQGTLGLELAGQDGHPDVPGSGRCDRVGTVALDPQAAERVNRGPIAGARVDEVGAVLRLRPPQDRGEAGQEPRRGREVAGHLLRCGSCHGGSPPDERAASVG